MEEGRISPLILKVADVPEEGLDEQWTLTTEDFSVDTHPLPVKGAVSLAGRVYRDGKTVYFSGEVEGDLGLECSRCLKEFPLHLKEAVTAVFMPKADLAAEAGLEEVELSGEDLDVQLYAGDDIDLYPPVRDQLALSAPMKPLCAEDCKGLCPTCGADLNEAPCGCEAREADNRFAALKKLFNKND
ncbi:MAG: DUF177 domain-containing protein [Nitrospinae bacterium]|nr:DUF177 domain-containing protein [Nitrospinota bacterium]